MADSNFFKVLKTHTMMPEAKIRVICEKAKEIFLTEANSLVKIEFNLLSSF